MLSESDGTNTRSFSYDSNGNDRPISASVEGNSLSYVYDGDNRRVSITSGATTTTHYYSPLGVVLEQQNGVDHARYVRSWRGEPLSISGPDGVFYYLYDGSGNVVGIINSAGAADWYSYQPFGEDLSMPGSPRSTPSGTRAATVTRRAACSTATTCRPATTTLPMAGPARPTTGSRRG